MGDDNTAARLLSRPGEAIYNDAAGAVEANSPFQVVWLPDEERDVCLQRIRTKQQETPCADGGSAFVFEGNAAADLTKNRALNALRAEPVSSSIASPTLWLGTPNAIKGPTATVLRRQGGDNLLIVGQQAEAALGVCIAAGRALVAQRLPDDVALYLFDGLPADHPLFGTLSASFPTHTGIHDVSYQEATPTVASLHEELIRRQADEATASTSIYVIIYGLQRYRKLRSDDDYSFSEEMTPDKQFAELLQEGPDLGIHCIVWCDSLSNLSRTLSRKTQKEFDQRVLFQMSPSDSMTLMDTPAASDLGPTRAIFYNEQDGIEEIFNPYAIPE